MQAASPACTELEIVVLDWLGKLKDVELSKHLKIFIQCIPLDCLYESCETLLNVRISILYTDMYDGKYQYNVT